MATRIPYLFSISIRVTGEPLQLFVVFRKT